MQWLRLRGGNEFGIAETVHSRRLPLVAHQRDRTGVRLQAIEVGAAKRRKRFELWESAGLLKGFGIQLNGRVRREHPGATAGVLFGMPGMGCAVRAEEETRIVAGGRFEQRLPVMFAFQHGQAIQVGTNAALEHGIAVEQQMLRRQRGAHVFAPAPDELDGGPRRDVFEHDFEAREAFDNGHQHFVDEPGFAVEDVDIRRRHFTMHLQHEATGFHRFEGRIDPGDGGDA